MWVVFYYVSVCMLMVSGLAFGVSLGFTVLTLFLNPEHFGFGAAALLLFGSMSITFTGLSFALEDKLPKTRRSR